MSQYSNTETRNLSPEAFRQAFKQLRELRDAPFDPTHLELNPHLVLDWSGVEREDPDLFMRLLHAQEEGAGTVVLPVEMYQELLLRGFLMWNEEPIL